MNKESKKNTSIMGKAVKSMSSAEKMVMLNELIETINLEDIPDVVASMAAQKLSIKAMQQSHHYISELKDTGNKKLVNTKETRFLIWSLPAVKTCPYATAECVKACYARKAETAYKHCLPCRKRALERTFSPDFVRDMVYTISVQLVRPCVDKATRLYVRIHEAGDFYNISYFDAWVQVSKAFKKFKKVKFLAYTKSLPILANSGQWDSKPANFRVLASEWADTKPEMLELREQLGLTVYTAVREDEFRAIKQGNGILKCFCKDCGSCRKCYTAGKAIRKIVVAIH